MTYDYDLSETHCPDCGEYFPMMYKQRNHAKETGHRQSEYCWNKFRKMNCVREKFHPGACGTRIHGGNYTSYFPSPLQKTMKKPMIAARKLLATNGRVEAASFVVQQVKALAEPMGYDLSDGWIVETHIKELKEFA
jgi:hypothetical protein